VAKNNKYVITNEQLRKLEAGRLREERKDAGYFDGRFAPKVQPSKKKYKRSSKHKNRDDE
jgi:hypothetical protein